MSYAIDNIIRYGDTDIFPYPIERKIFRDKKEDALKLLLAINKDFDQVIVDMPIEHEKLLCAVGYTGFRQGTQIDPIWNAYLLGLVILIGDDIEKNRTKIEKEVVFSYRFKPDAGDLTIFNRDIGWIAFQKKSIELAKKNNFVLTCDISDFYPRIYHHRLENALKKTTDNSFAIHQVKKILKVLSKGVSYGLPVGGPAARLLSELLLNRTDKLLLAKNINFCRFVDDFRIFGESKKEIYDYLVYLSEILLENEGLSLQKQKSRVMTTAEFLDTSLVVNESDDSHAKDKKEFIKLHIHYDPYSDTADEDYDALCKELSKFDIVGMLASELQKTRVSESLTRKLIKAVAHVNKTLQRSAIISILDNLNVLYPIFPTVMILLRGITKHLDEETRECIFKKLRETIQEESHLCKVPVNLAFIIRVLAFDNSEETDSVLIQVFSRTSSMMIKRDIILILAQHDSDFWISDQLKRYNVATPWEKRSLIIASYILEDEGREWRRRMKKKNRLSPFDLLALEWAGEQKDAGNEIELS